MANKRQRYRVPYGKELVARMDDGFIVSGVASDINEGGFFLEPHDKKNLSSRLNQGGVLLIDLDAERVELPFQVVRVTPSGMGIQFQS